MGYFRNRTIFIALAVITGFYNCQGQNFNAEKESKANQLEFNVELGIFKHELNSRSSDQYYSSIFNTIKDRMFTGAKLGRQFFLLFKMKDHSEYIVIPVMLKIMKAFNSKTLEYME